MTTRNQKAGRIGAIMVGSLIGLAMAHPGLAGEGRSGARVLIKAGGAIQKGELVGVRQDGLVIISEQQISTVPIADIESVRIVHKASKLLAGWAGSFLGGAASIPIARAVADNTSGDWGDAIGAGSAVLLGGAVVGAVAGVLLADGLAKDEVFVFKGRPVDEIAKNLEQLRKQARIQDYR